MSKVEIGKTLKVHYTGKFENEEVFDTSEGREPLEFTVGQGQLITGFENGVVGMEAGEKKTLEIEANEAYGEIREDLVQEVNTSQLPEGVKVGDLLQAPTPEGSVNVTVTNINEDKATVDANHPLAGKKLIFELEVVEVSE
jgi:FKBP-type peptidyl-prolyl cis-trans isomerase SlpA